MTIRVGLIGARGYVGREMLTLMAHHPKLELAFASSREWAGQPVADMLEGADTGFGGLAFEALGPEEAAARKADAVILGLPNGKSTPFVEAIDVVSPETIIIDLSGDHRHEEGWVYGLPERNRDKIAGARRIANPGCYATAAQLAIMPLTDLWAEPVHTFGLSGWSGAGTTPSRRNDPEALKDNAMPYGLMGHGHEKEISAHSGLDVRFTPTVASFFRGLVVVASGSLKEPTSASVILELYKGLAEAEPFVTLTDEPAEPAEAANRHDCLIGRPAVSDDSTRVVVTAALDNLLKGAASQAIQNLNIIKGWPEETGLTPSS